MTDLRTAAQQALEALALAQLNGEAGLRDYEVLEIAESAVALKAALAEPVQEPQRKPLETKQLEQIMADCFADKSMPPNWWHWSLRSFARAIERAHGIGGQE